MTKIIMKSNRITSNASIATSEKKCITSIETALDKLLDKQALGAPLELTEIKTLEILTKLVIELRRNQLKEEELNTDKAPGVLHNHIHASSEDLKKLVSGDGKK